MHWRQKIASLDVDGVIVTQGTDTLEETSFLLDLLVERDIPVIVTAAMRNPALTSPDGPGNLLAAVRVACDPWVQAHAKALGVIAVMLDEVYAAADVLKIHPTRLNAFASPQTGPLAALVEDRVVPLSLPVRAPVEAARKRLGAVSDGKEQPVALLWMGLDEPGYLLEAMVDHRDQSRLSRRRAGRDGWRPCAGAGRVDWSASLPRSCRPWCRRAPVAGRCCARPMAAPVRRSRCARPA